MKNAIVLALLLMRMVAEEIVMEAEGNQPQICAEYADQQGRCENTKRGALMHRTLICHLLLSL
jgi:hypothetical protein